MLSHKKFYCLNLTFWISMGCGIARFGRRGLNLNLNILVSNFVPLQHPLRFCGTPWGPMVPPLEVRGASPLNVSDLCGTIPLTLCFYFFFLKIQMWKGSRDNIYSLCISALFSISLYPSPTEAKPAATTPLRLWTLQITVVQISLHKSPQIRISDPPILLFGLESLPLEQLWTEKGNNFWRKKLSVNLILTVMAFWKGGEGKKS